MTELDSVLNELDLSGPVSPYYSLVAFYGRAIIDRALELSKGQPPEANFMPYIYKALEEARASETVDYDPSPQT